MSGRFVVMGDKRECVKERIVSAALDLFRRYGVKTVTMDDIASSLAISKRTLYEQFGNKESILVECILYRVDKDRILKEANDSLPDMLLDCALCVAGLQKSIDRRCLWDIRKYYEGAHTYLTDIIKGYAEICKNRVPDAIAGGYIREDTSPCLVYLFLSDQLSKLFLCSGTGGDDFDEEMVARSILAFARGISTEKGRLYMDDKLNNRTSDEIN